MSYWRVYIVMVKPAGEKNFRPLQEHYQGSTNHPVQDVVIAYETRKAARETARSFQGVYGRENIYVQMCGAIS